MMNTTIDSKSRLKWACRRGMLELDLLLMPFVDHVFDTLPDAEKAIFERLLNCDDPQLFCWFMGQGQSDDPALAAMVKKVLSHKKV